MSKQRFKQLDNEVPLSIRATVNRQDGYGAFAYYMFEELAARRVNFKIIPGSVHPITVNGLSIALRKALDLKDTGCNALVDYTSVHEPNKFYGFKQNIAFTMFETTKPPDRMIGAVNTYDALFTPSDFCSRVFCSAGVTVPVYTVGHGINPRDWPFTKRTQTARQLGRPFRLLLYSNGGWNNSRKNYQLTVDAFLDAFSAFDCIELVLKTPMNAPVSNVERFSPKIRVIKADYSQPQLVDLLGTIDCLVFASNGEGFGLPPREAMATGVPAIVSSWSALETLTQVPGLCYSVPVRSLQKADYRFYTIYGNDDVGEYACVLKNDLAQAMRDAYDNQEKTLAMGQYAASWVRQNETVSQVVDKISGLLKLGF